MTENIEFKRRDNIVSYYSFGVDSIPVALLCVTENNEIVGLLVDNAYRRNGLATRLIEKASNEEAEPLWFGTVPYNEPMIQLGESIWWDKEEKENEVIFREPWL